MLWGRLRNRALGVRVRRQHPFGPYVLDFFCPERGLVVEVDGDQHGEEERALADEARRRFLAARGLRVLRFSNVEVLRETEGVLARIREALSGGG